MGRFNTFCLIVLLGFPRGASLAAKKTYRPALHAEIPTTEWETLLTEKFGENPPELSLDKILKAGRRNLKWLEKLNGERPDDPLALFVVPAPGGIPISRPLIYNQQTILDGYAKLLVEAPEPFTKTVLGTSRFPLSHDLPSDEAYLALARRLDYSYQFASRWKFIASDLPALETLAAWDIRGYYFLSKVRSLKSKLEKWSDLSAEDQQQYAIWLVGMCRNSEKSRAACRGELTRELNTIGHPEGLYRRYLTVASETLDSLFALETNQLAPGEFRENGRKLHVRFNRPEKPELERWLKRNVESHWNVGKYQLVLDYVDDDPKAPRLVFRRGATPHVAGLQLVMNSDRHPDNPQDNLIVAHEFGHVLGFVDCYVEFYDDEQGAIVSYQIDPTNIMCSRSGRVQESHFQSLVQHYPTAQ